MKLITRQQLDLVYQLFEKSFIPAELRPYEFFCSLFDNHELKIYSQEQDGHIEGALIIWEFDSFVYVENFAVDENLRGRGIGGNLLEELKLLYPQYPIILEVDEPKDEISRRRIGFYQRHQWMWNPYSYIQPQLRENVDDVRLFLMSYPYAIDEKQFHQIKDNLLTRVYKRGQQKNERIRR